MHSLRVTRIQLWHVSLCVSGFIYRNFPFQWGDGDVGCVFVEKVNRLNCFGFGDLSAMGRCEIRRQLLYWP